MNPLTALASLAALAGLGLHAWIWLAKAEGGFDLFALGMLLFATTPYLACLVLAWRWTALGGLLGALAALPIDLAMYHAVFIEPTSSTAALALLVTPIATIFAAAVGVLLGRFIQGRLAARASSPPG
jgi:hypothetical protein